MTSGWGTFLLRWLLLIWHAPDDVRIARIDDGQCAHPEVFTTGCAKLNVVSTVMVDTGLGQHGIVLDLRFPEGRAVVGQDDQLGFPLTDHLLGLFVAQDVLSTLHHQLESGVDGLHRLFLCEQDALLQLATAPELHG